MRKLRPSNAHQWMNCGLAAHAPWDRPEEEQDAALEGTCAAWVAETIINGDATDVEDMRGETHPNGWDVDDDMIRYMGEYLRILPQGGQAEVFMQSKYLEGTADHIAWLTSKHLKITDLKYGYRVVEAFENWQLLCYLALFLNGLDMKQWPDTVTLSIYQPRAIHENGPHRTWTISMDEYRIYTQQIANRILELVNGETTAHVGPQCSYCMSAVGCQALTQSVYKCADLLSESRVYHAPDARELSDEMTMLTRMEEILKARKTAVETDMEYRMSRGGFIPDWILQPRYGKKRFTLDQIGVEMVTGLDASEVKLCTPAELIRRGADKGLVDSITTTPRIGYKLERFKGEEQALAQFRAVQPKKD